MPFAELLRRALRPRFVEVQDGDARAVLGEQAGGGEADPAGAGGAGNSRGLAGKQHLSLPIIVAALCASGFAAANEKFAPMR